MTIKRKIAVVGLGYVGLPVAVAFGRRDEIVGFDISERRIAELKEGRDSTGEVSSEELRVANVKYTSDPTLLKKCDFIIVAVPTPIDDAKRPDLKPVIKASEIVGRNLSKGAIVVYESTVYPGVTEEICLPILEKESGLRGGVDFKVGYSPERINPGDREHTFTKIVKVVSGQDVASLETIAQVYESVVEAGVHRAPSIKVAEAAKVIENTQRDLNLALMNELAVLFDKMNINTRDVLKAAGTKWNFLPFEAGLVGGHCIGVDPYYLLHKSQSVGYIPDLIRHAREINDSMSDYLAKDFLMSLIKRKINPLECRVGLFGFTFKANCPDIRNTKVFDLYNALVNSGFKVTIYDPWASLEEVKVEYGIDIKQHIDNDFDVGFLAVGHDEFLKEFERFKDKYIYDFQGIVK